MYCLLHQGRRFFSEYYGCKTFNSVLYVISRPKRSTTLVPNIVYRSNHLAAATYLLSERKLLKRDNMPSNYQLIYRLEKDYLWVTGCTTSIVLLLVLWCIWLRQNFRELSPIYDRDVFDHLQQVSTSGFELTDTDFNIYFISGTVVGLLLYFLAKHLPLRIYFNGKHYVAIYMNSFLPFLRKKYLFTSGRKPRRFVNIPALTDSYYILGRRKARLYADYFRTPLDFYKMTGQTSIGEND